MRVQVALKAIPTIGKAALAAGTAAAIGAGVKGAVDILKGRSIRKKALKRFDDAIAECEATRVDTERAAREYGEFQIRVHKETVGRFADWLERNEHLVKRLNFKKVDGVRIRVPNIPKYVASVENVTTGVIGLASGVGAGAAAQAGALWGVSDVCVGKHWHSDFNAERRRRSERDSGLVRRRCSGSGRRRGGSRWCSSLASCRSSPGFSSAA